MRANGTGFPGAQTGGALALVRLVEAPSGHAAIRRVDRGPPIPCPPGAGEDGGGETVKGVTCACTGQSRTRRRSVSGSIYSMPAASSQQPAAV
jgi:hypothetical protein